MLALSLKLLGGGGGGGGALPTPMTPMLLRYLTSVGVSAQAFTNGRND